MLHWKSVLAALLALSFVVVPARAQQPAAGSISVGQGAALPLWKVLAGDCTLATSGTITCTKTNGTPFGSFAGVTITPTRPGDIVYWNGSAWINFAGNNSGTQVLAENASGVPSWATVAGTGTVASITAAGGLTGGTITTSGTIQTPGGFLNKLRNGSFVVWQRGTSALATSTTAPGSYTADGWQVQQAGAAGTCAQDTGNNGTLFSLRCVGIASNTDTVFGQPIEAAVASPLAGQTVTVQIAFKQDTGVSVTPKLSTCFASATNNFSTCTGDLASTNLSACTSGSWCVESYTLAVSSSASNGYRVNFDCNTALTSAQHCWITAADVRVTPGVTTGINSSPPPPELRPIGAELAFCQRYYETSYPQGTAPGTSTVNGMTFFGVTAGLASAAYGAIFTTFYKVTKRASPSVTMYSPSTGTSGKVRDFLNSADVTPLVNSGSNDSQIVWSATNNAAAAGYEFGAQWTSSAEL